MTNSGGSSAFKAGPPVLVGLVPTRFGQWIGATAVASALPLVEERRKTLAGRRRSSIHRHR